MRSCAAALIAARSLMLRQAQQEGAELARWASSSMELAATLSFARAPATAKFSSFAALSSAATSFSPPTPSSSSSSSATFATDARRLRAAKSRAIRAATKAAAPPPEVASPRDSTSSVASSSSDHSFTPPASLAAAVSHPALVVARGIEWGNVVLGFEQANRYTVLDETGRTVALLAEETSGVGSAVARQVLRARRSFVASLLSPDGSQVLARVCRPLYLVNSTTAIEDGDGNVVGEVVQRWHPLRRKYDLFVDKVQVAEIDSPLLAWEFTLTDADGRPIALIDRNFSGFGKELFTDAGRYAVHFGESSKQDAAAAVRRTIEAAHPEAKPAAIEASVEKALVATSPSASSSNLVATSTGGVLALARPLEVDERLAALAAAIAIDFDYFSRHSSAGGGMMPFMLPMPVPSVPAPVEPPPVGAVGGAEGGEAGGGEGAAAAGGGSGGGSGFGGEEPLERDLGGGEVPPPWGQEDSDFNESDDFGSLGGGGNDDDGGGEGDSGWSWDDGGGDGGGGGAAGGLFDLLRDIFHQD